MATHRQLAGAIAEPKKLGIGHISTFILQHLVVIGPLALQVASRSHRVTHVQQMLAR